LDVGLPYSNIYNTAVLYGGLGNNFWLEVGGVVIAVPIEPVGVVILGIDGMRQDVLYAPQGSSGSDVKASYPETNGCNDQSCYTDLSSVKGICAVMGGKYTETLGISSCDPIGAENKHIKLPNVTTIFPSITFAAWASIFTGMTPSATGITGNEFFARDLYYASVPINVMVPGMNTLPSGMVTLDADGGAMRAKPTGGLVSSLLGWQTESAPFALNYVMPAEFLGYNMLSEKIATSAPGDVLKAVPLWKAVNDIVTRKYQINTADRCDQSANECRTVSMFNQYAAGADWWGTPSVKWMTLWKTAWEGSIFDSASTSETVDFISNYFKQTTTNGKRKRFPALFSVYLPGLDHDAHMSGMSDYTRFVRETLDSKIEDIVDALKRQDEFDNKLFIVVSDHGHTAMPTDLTYIQEVPMQDMETQEPYVAQFVRQAEMSCVLKTNFAVNASNDYEGKNAQNAELNNNSLHIWELANLFTLFPSPVPGVTLKILAPTEIANITTLTGATSSIESADIVAALNGPMAHIYIKGTDWQSDPNPQIMNLVLNRLFFYLKSGLTSTGRDYELLNQHFPRLMNSIGDILIRKSVQTSSGIEYTYEVVTSISEDASGNLNVASVALTNSIGDVDAVNRINNMNSFNRSGDIVIIMRDSTTGDEEDRYSTAYACKSWHGSLNASDSYVPFILSYPGGNKSELSVITDVVCANNSCKSNWTMPELIKAIIKRQY
jgi:hypothetical protein